MIRQHSGTALPGKALPGEANQVQNTLPQVTCQTGLPCSLMSSLLEVLWLYKLASPLGPPATAAVNFN